jgi:hypothetical protein
MNRHQLAVLLIGFTLASGALAQGGAPKKVEVRRQPSAAAGGTASPQDTRASASLFRELDRNGDGVLTADELSTDQARRGNWIAIDRNRDGRITPSEFRAVNPR